MTAEAEKALVATIEAISAELATMPLEKEYRDRRLALNQRREALERQLANLRRSSMIEAELAALREQLEAAPDTERRALKRRQRELTTELESLRGK